MPPIRTAKLKERPKKSQLDEDAAVKPEAERLIPALRNITEIKGENAASATNLKAKQSTPAMPKQHRSRALKCTDGTGILQVRFELGEHWEERKTKIGSKTKKIFFGPNFPVADSHIHEIIDMGPNVCRSLSTFQIECLSNVTHEAVIQLASTFPNLHRVLLDGLPIPNDHELIVYFQKCPQLTALEIRPWSEDTKVPLRREALDLLRKNPLWAPKLRKLMVPAAGRLYGAAEDLTGERKKLFVQLVDVYQHSWASRRSERYFDYREGYLWEMGHPLIE